ncbi:MAG: o-succinylbenzoate synthase [Polyangiaceae bacterium]
MAAVTLRVSLSGAQRTLARRAQNAKQGWTEREACLITLHSRSGFNGSGEASPLPGFSPDRLADCAAALSAFDPTNIPEQLEAGQAALTELSRASARLPAHLPAARAALEAALLDLWSRSVGQPAWALLAPTRARPAARSLAALLMGEPEQALAQAQQAQARGIRSFKFKIGRPDALERELLAVAELRRGLGPTARLRLDANQSLSVSDARVYLPLFAEHELEYIEEPCAPRDLPRLADLGLPIAWDESLRGAELPASPLRALVLKPTLLGGVSACAHWAEQAARIGADVVVSHAFEGPLGLALSAAVALSWGSESLAHGLDMDGARLAPNSVPFLSSAGLEAWSEPGFGLPEPS